VYVDGGATIRQFLAAGLITDLTVSVVPVLLGEGIPLFGGVAHDLHLEGVKHWAGGLVQLRYQTKSRR
jgi:dihydrofolate reductase